MYRSTKKKKHFKQSSFFHNIPMNMVDAEGNVYALHTIANFFNL